MKLAGKVALVTGASAGIGKASALALAQEGADVAINYLTFPEAAEELAAQIRKLGRKALLCQVDVSDQPAVEAMVERLVRAEIERQVKELGVNYLLTYLFLGTMSLADALRSLQLFSTEVMPHLAKL